ncbi:hypothetical protein PQ465_01080 [Sphingobacterium oryzagri]|uniref:Uncharacterized protein n=1 Tax=Sphingobacterium oryzagri TaxID=3025669 RepID=A0ABY7WKQ5_9SPHI|nr:hypothetical protein [Sphingobacterium sp. KACC 22765]WDF68983.1 hypothetical protein PQ465_01080 [Sphingobacterium sp. KACC 22765]
MKFRKFTIYALALSLFAGVASCESPLKDFNLQISTEVISHSATLRLVNTNGTPITSATVTLVSGDTEDIYNLSGRKEFSLTDNLITFGVDPKRMPTAADPIRFRVQIVAPGYITQVVPVAITDASTGIETVVLAQPTSLPGGATQLAENVALATDGSTLQATTVAIASPIEGTASNMELTIPAGTQFIGADGNVVTGSSVSISVINIDPNHEDAVSLLPGGDLISDQVVLEDGTTQSGAFSSAAVARIVMLVNGVRIREFSQPIRVTMPISTDYVSPLTNEAVNPGHILQVFSNSDTDNIWRWESNTAVQGTVATGYTVAFDIDHLTFYMVGEFGVSCSSARNVTFSGDWMANGSTYPIIVETWYAGNLLKTAQFSISANNATISLLDIPETGASIVVKNGAGQELEQGPLAGCGATTTMQLPNPGDATNSVSTLQLYVRCPDQTNPITLLPTFQMFYRVHGTTEYKYLGAVDNGFLRTTLLNTNGTRYDFKAIWKERVKVVGDKTIQADNTATVGIAPGDIIGEKAGATNLGILTEECGNL